MKKKLIGLSLLICLGATNLVHAQQTKTKVKVKPKPQGQVKPKAEEKVYTVADQMPTYTGGETALKLHFQEALLSKNFPSSGVVTLSLIIDKSGQPKDIAVAEGMNPDVDSKVLETARKMPFWQPGKKDGQPINVRLSLPINVPAAKSLEPVEDPKIYTFVEQPPYFPGGDSRMHEFFASNMQYPAAARKNGLEGMVVVSYVVKTDGTISEPKILKSLGKDLDGEALRLLSIMPTWTPGKQNGRAVNVRYTLPIRFRLESQAEKR